MSIQMKALRDFICRDAETCSGIFSVVISTSIERFRSVEVTEYVLDSHDEEYNKELRIELCFEDAGIYLKLLDIFEQ
ncbi:MAG: hypothetical protein JW883_02655 [Deltaproteobacteria bacterium]|nr:hypothetical protein [Deltaproteobacteria bacterium]